jgi:hypothetical protein
MASRAVIVLKNVFMSMLVSMVYSSPPTLYAEADLSKLRTGYSHVAGASRKLSIRMNQSSMLKQAMVALPNSWHPTAGLGQQFD